MLQLLVNSFMLQLLVNSFNLNPAVLTGAQQQQQQQSQGLTAPGTGLTAAKLCRLSCASCWQASFWQPSRRQSHMSIIEKKLLHRDLP
jgi:hypothetical protein